MAPKTNLTKKLNIALRDQRVQDDIFETKQQRLLGAIAKLQADNARKSKQISKLQEDLQSTATQIEAPEIHNRNDNLLITGLPISSYAKAVGSSAESEASQALEQSILQKFNQPLELPIKSTDIYIAHRLEKSRSLHESKGSRSRLWCRMSS